MSYKVKFDNGTVVSFENEPTQQDIDDASQHLAKNLKPAPVKEQPKGFFKQIGDRLLNVGTEINKSIEGAAQRYDVAKANNDPMALPSLALSASAVAPKAALSLAMEGVKQILPQGFKNDMKSFIGTVANNPNVQKDIVQPATKLAQENPKTAQAVQDVTDIAAILPGPKVLSEAEKIAVKTAKEASKIAPIAKNAAVAATEALAKTPEQLAAIKLANQAKVDDVVNTIIQGKTKDIAKAKKTLSQIDTTGVKTYDDLAPIIQNHTDNLLEKVDELFGQDGNLYKLKDLKLKKTVGDQTVSYNYVNRALNNLQELYTKTKDITKKAEIQQLREKISNEGITLKEVNKLAKDYGTEIGSKAFNKQSGEALTSVNSQTFENIRSGVKDTARSLSTNKKAIEALDMEASNAIRTNDLIKKMVEKVSALESKIKKENAIMKTGRTIGKVAGKVVDVATGGTARAFLTSFLPSNIGNKVMNSIDLQKALRTNLIKINKLNSASGENFFNQLNKIIK